MTFVSQPSTAPSRVPSLVTKTSWQSLTAGSQLAAERGVGDHVTIVAAEQRLAAAPAFSEPR
jgi:hypothetical protein